MRGIQLGTYALNYKTALEQFSSYVQIQKKGFQQNPSLNKSFLYDEALQSKLNNIPEVPAYTPRVYADGLISYKDVSLGASIFGIAPEKEKRVTTLFEKIRKGKFFEGDSSNKIVLGEILLENLKAEVGDTIVILAQGYDGSLANQKFIISGSIKIGQKEFDAMAVFMGLEAAQYMLGMGKQINVIAVDANGLKNADEVQKILSLNINNDNLAVLLWKDVVPELEQLIQFDNVSGIFFLGILIVIVAFGILNTILMSVTERFKEFGVQLAIGMPNKNLVKLVYLETIFLTLMGLILGNIIGYAINYYLVQNPILLGGELSKVYEEYNFLPELISSLDISIFFNVSLSIIIISVISSIYPAYKVFKLEPLKGIRYT